MTKGITVHTGVANKGTPRERRSAWVETVIPLQLEARELADGLGSKYLRHETCADDERMTDRPKSLPDLLTQREILRTYREELLHYGEQVLGIWGDEMGLGRRAVCEKWLTALVLDAFPEMKGYER